MDMARDGEQRANAGEEEGDELVLGQGTFRLAVCVPDLGNPDTRS
jgi:hypothetical protein